MKLDIIRAWKDETYRQSLSYEQLGALPQNPAGELELTDTDLQSVSGGGESFGSFDSFGGGAFFRREEEFINSRAVVCENPIFSNTNIRNVADSFVRVTNLCVNFN
jgi:mersacidin/lichenicidin family type 2 lantibiotic